MLQENLKDAAQILQNIITQSLFIPGASENVSLLSAARSFDEEDAHNSDLYKVLSTFRNYPGPTQTLIVELDILAKEIMP